MGGPLVPILRDRRGPLADVFWNYVAKGDGCWAWLGHINEDGYGDRSEGGRLVLAHRFSWEIANGPIPDGMGVLHECDNRACVRPDHLFLGTNADNQTDKIAKGREARGETCRQKLNESNVIDIRTLHAFGAERDDLAAVFNISGVMVGKIIRRESWAHLP